MKQKDLRPRSTGLRRCSGTSPTRRPEADSSRLRKHVQGLVNVSKHLDPARWPESPVVAS